MTNTPDTMDTSVLQGIPLDVKLFRTPEGIEKVKISQSRRFPIDDSTSDEQKGKQKLALEIVDKVVEYDELWRKSRYETDELKKKKGIITKQIKEFAKQKKFLEMNPLRVKCKSFDQQIKDTELKSHELEKSRNYHMCMIGNICPENRGMVWTHDESKSPVIYTHGLDHRLNTKESPVSVFDHIELVRKLGVKDNGEGNAVCGSRGFYLRGLGCFLNQALINYGLQFLHKKKFDAIHCPFFVRKSMMGKCAQLDDFDEQLYSVTGQGEDKYLIATAEQPICLFYADKELNRKDLPIKHAGYSSCFRKEAGHSSNDKGIFRVHQFEKVEQFVITDPDSSWEMMEEMLSNSREFYESLNIPYQVINIVSGDLNNAAAQKYDLEAWFPSGRCFRELVSCSNCTDYQSRRLNTKISSKGGFVHMLNSTLCATERTMCCILENNQTDTGVKIPQVLVPFMPDGIDFIPFVE
jgi:seryl-tRNA synthetase